MASFNIEKRFTLQTVLATVCNCRGLIVLKLARYISPCLGKTSTGLLSLYVCVHNSATCDQCQFQLYYQTISVLQKQKFWLHLSRRLGRLGPLGPLGPLTHRPASPFHGVTPTWQARQMHITSGRCHDCNDCHAFCEILLQSPLLVNQSSVG